MSHRGHGLCTTTSWRWPITPERFHGARPQGRTGRPRRRCRRTSTAVDDVVDVPRFSLEQADQFVHGVGSQSPGVDGDEPTDDSRLGFARACSFTSQCGIHLRFDIDLQPFHGWEYTAVWRRIHQHRGPVSIALLVAGPVLTAEDQQGEHPPSLMSRCVTAPFSTPIPMSLGSRSSAVRSLTRPPAR